MSSKYLVGYDSLIDDPPRFRAACPFFRPYRPPLCSRAFTSVVMIRARRTLSSAGNNPFSFHPVVFTVEI
jgi:hypothetical protein